MIIDATEFETLPRMHLLLLPIFIVFSFFFPSGKVPYPFFFPPPLLPTSSPHSCKQQDKSFTFVLKTPPASVLLKKAAGIDKGSAQLEKVGSITKEQLEVCAAPPTQAARLLFFFCNPEKLFLVFFPLFPRYRINTHTHASTHDAIYISSSSCLFIVQTGDCQH